MKRIALAFAAVMILLQIHTKAQILQWNQKYNRGSSDVITAMIADAAGNTYVTGYSVNSANNADYVTIKYTTSGTKQWVAIYNGPGSGNDVADAICIDRNGNAYVTGYSDALTGGYVDNDATTIKYDKNGNPLWIARYDGGFSRTDKGRAIKADDAGNVYITGYTTERKNGGAHGDINYLTVKYNASGKQLWASVYAGPAQQPNDQVDSANAIGLDAAGNVYVTGVSNGNAPSHYNLHQDFLTVKYSAAGQELWTARYDGTGHQIDDAYALATNKQGDVFVTGLSTGSGTNDYDFALIKYNTDGATQWVRRHDGPAPDAADAGYALILDDNNNVYVTGTDEASDYNEDIFTSKYTADGILQWKARYDGGDNDDPTSIALDKMGNVYVAGYSTHEQTGEDMITIQYNNSGTKQWVAEFNGSNNFEWDVANAVAIDSANNVYVAGYTTNIDGNTDYTVLKYSSNSIAAKNKSANQDDVNAFLLYQNTPNPFSNQTHISFKLQNRLHPFSVVKLWIEDASGKPLSVLIDKQLPNGDYNVTWNAQYFLPGVYYCRLLCNNTVQTRKLVLVK